MNNTKEKLKKWKIRTKRLTKTVLSLILAALITNCVRVGMDIVVIKNPEGQNTSEVAINPDIYDLNLENIGEYEFDDKTTYNFYTGSFSVKDNADKSRDEIESKLFESDEFYTLCNNSIKESKKEKSNFRIEVIENNTGKHRVCILKDIKGTILDMRSLETLIEEKFNIGVEIIAYNHYIEAELFKINNLIENKELKKALDGLLKLRHLCKEQYVNGFSEYDKRIEKIILENDKLKELYIVGKEKRDSSLNFINEI